MAWYAAGWRTCLRSLKSVLLCQCVGSTDLGQEALALTALSNNKTDEVSVTCLDFPDNDTSTFWIGTEESSIYQANRYDRASAKAGLVASADDVYRGHAGPVTGLHFHPGTGPIDLSDLFLTSSVDWTVKLWRAKAGTKSGAGNAPVHSFEEADDYVFDVKWHPNHPAMFGTVDGTGKFDLWNLNQDVEVSRLISHFKSLSSNWLPAGPRRLDSGLASSNQPPRLGSHTSLAESRSRLVRRQAVHLRRRGEGCLSAGQRVGGDAEDRSGTGGESGCWRRSQCWFTGDQWRAISMKMGAVARTILRNACPPFGHPRLL